MGSVYTKAGLKGAKKPVESNAGVRSLSEFYEFRYDKAEFPLREGDVVLSYYVSKPDEGGKIHFGRYDDDVGYIDFSPATGQVGLIGLVHDLHGKTLGKQMLQKAIDEMRASGATEVWAVTSKGHKFWSNVFNKSFTYRKPAHPTVTGDGYYMKL